MSEAARFRRKRAENLADYLRERIRNGELANPLPTTRIWCGQLGVGRPSLLKALKALEHEGLVTVGSRAVMLNPQTRRGRKAGPRILRILYFNRNAPNLRRDSEWVSRLSERLSTHDIHVAVESCSITRLRALARDAASEELCVLMATPPEYQRLFQESGKAAFIIGYPGEGIELPYLTGDLDSAVRHATQTLLRRGFARVVMVSSSHKAAGVPRSVEAFRVACAEWPHQPIRGEVAMMWKDITSMRTGLKRVAGRITGRCGIVICSPISAGVLISSLLEAGIKIPKQAEIMAIEHLSEEVQFSVPVTRYAFPREQCIKQLVEVAREYFDTGEVPKVRRRLALNVTAE